MKMKVMAQGVLAAVFAVAVAMPATASDTGWYVGANAGQVMLDDTCDDFIGSCDDTDFGWKAFGGYQATPMWGFELFYTDLGEVSVRDDGFKGDIEAEGVGMFVTGTLPIGRGFDLFGKFGAMLWDVEAKFSETSSSGFDSESNDEDDIDLAFGVGVKHSFTRNFSVRVEWDRFENVGDGNTTGQGDLDMFSAGAVFSF